MHYVWLAAGAAAPPSPPNMAAADVVGLLEDSAEEPEEKASKGPEKAIRKPPKTTRRPKKGTPGHFAKGHSVGSRTRFRRQRSHYGTCRKCKSSEETFSRGTDWYCKRCSRYTKKRGAAGRKS